MPTYIVHFHSGITGTCFRSGEYKSRKAIRRAQDRYSLEYGAHLSVKIYTEGSLDQVNIFDVEAD